MHFTMYGTFGKNGLSFHTSGEIYCGQGSQENLPNVAANCSGSSRRIESTARRERRHPVAFFPDGEAHLALADCHLDLGPVLGKGWSAGRHLGLHLVREDACHLDDLVEEDAHRACHDAALNAEIRCLLAIRRVA